MAPSADGAIVVPVNAQGDQQAAATLLDDLARYRGRNRLDIVCVLNNYPSGQEPPGRAELEKRGARVIAVPDARQKGLSVFIGARSRGARAVSAEPLILFDADCRVPDPTAVVDWYVSVLTDDADAAYTTVRHHSVSPHLSVRLRVRLHHAARWTKRVILRIPTLRGSNYAIRRSRFLALVDRGRIVHDIDVGPAVKADGGRIRYGSSPELRVLTSGRYLRPGWWRVIRYVPKRIGYHVRLFGTRR